jgi:hypothetical protein
MFKSQRFVGVTNFGKRGSERSDGPHVGDQQQGYHFASMGLLYHQWTNLHQQYSCVHQKSSQQLQDFKEIFRNIKKVELTTILRHEVGSKRSK